MSFLDVITILACVYIIGESLQATVNMGEGLKGFYHKAKYAFFSFSAVVIAHQVVIGCNNFVYAFVVPALALAVWPRMLWRLRAWGLLHPVRSH